jgi:hypothetical protein
VLKPGGDDDNTKHRQRKQLCDGAGNTEHERRAEGYEVTGDVGREQALQRKEAGGVDEAGVEAEQQRERWPPVGGHDRTFSQNGCYRAYFSSNPT